jgi:trimeric autotransporter adhesin
MTVKFSRTSRLFFTVVCAICLSFAHSSWAASTSTTTALTLGSNGQTIAENGSVTSGSVLTLTATVTAGTASVTVGSVSFCDATVTLCSDIHLIGTAQITASGTAVFKFIPGIGTHTYKAVFAGTPNGSTAYADSSSSTATFTVTGTYPTTTTLASSGAAGNYSLTSTVVGAGSPALTGTVSFIDTTNANSILATQSVGVSVGGLGLLDASTLDVGPDPSYNVIADFNGDGIPDLAVTNDSTVTVLLGKGDGTFTPAPQSPITVTFNCRDLIVGDFNHDGKLDLAMTNSYYNGIVTVLLGNGDGTFTPAPGNPTSVGNSFQYVNSLVVGDFNGDGLQDIAVGISTGGYGGGQYLGVLVVLLGNGDGTFKQLPGVNLAQYPSLATGDFNRDGIADIAIVDHYANDVAIYLGNGDGTFQPALNSPVAVGQGADSAVAADLNDDGILDLAVSSQTGILTNGTVSILLGKGDGTFTLASASPTVGITPFTIAYGDFNGDGKTDLATANNTDSTVSYLLGKGDGTFQPVIASIYLGQFTMNFATADVNGDGFTDVIAVTDANPSGSLSGIGSVLLSQPTVTSTAVVNGINPLGTGTHQIQASYPGSSSYSDSTSNLVALTAEPAAAAINISLSAATITTTQPLSVTVAVSGPRGAPAPTGSIILTSGSYTSPSTPLSGGSATISISAGALAVGSDTITAAYNGDTNYTKTTASSTVSVTAIPPSFAIASSSVAITAPGGATSNTSTITITPAGGFTGTVSLTAALASSPAGAVDPPTFSFGSTPSVAITGTTPATATLTILTSPASNASLHPPKLFHSLTGGEILACLLFFALPQCRRKKLGTLALAFFLALFIGSLSGCSSGSNAPTNPGTTPGSYTVSVTGTSGALTTTSPVTFTVQ